MPKFTVAVSQTALITIEAESSEKLDEALDDEETFADMMEFLEDPSNWEVEAEITPGDADAPVELQLEGGVLLVPEGPPGGGPVRKKIVKTE